MRMDFFPIDKIENHSKILLYGAGHNGRYLFEINEKISWCEILAIVDKNARNVDGYPIPVITPEEISSYEDYDYILISIFNYEVRLQIVKNLVELGVPHKKIVSDIECTFGRDEKSTVLFKRKVQANERISIALWPKGAMGDHIIFLKMYQEIVRLAPDADITVLVEYDSFPKSILYGQKNLKEMKRLFPEWDGWKDYDLVLEVRFEPAILYVDFDRIEMGAPDLFASLKVLYKYQQYDYVELPFYQYANRVLLDRAKFFGLNRYTLFNISGAFDITNQNVDFYIDDSYLQHYNNLKIDKPYFTYNFGASDMFKKGVQQVKQWPYEYHVELNKLFKKRYPNIELIQLGSNNVVQIPGADRYILGQPLDVVKYILKNSICHFDCEGGLVHMASQLGTKCFVAFGPTQAWFLGYENNENITPKICGECKGLIKDWYIRCYKYDRPECMYSITPEDVMERISRYIDSVIS